MLSQPDDSALERVTMRRVSQRLLPLLFVLYICNYLDRINVAIAALQMNRDLRFSATAYGFGTGIFFISYALLEVPSNVVLARLGARRWISRIMLSWGAISTCMMFVRTPLDFYVLRFLLGAAEAGFFPGVIYYLGQWFPAAWRARASARFMIAIPFSAMIAGPLGGALLGLDGHWGLAGWQWLFLLEGLPSIVFGFVVLAALPDRPADAPWLSEAQRHWLTARIQREEDASRAPRGVSVLRALAMPIVWAVATPYLLINTAGYAFGFWAPTVIRDALHTSDAVTGVIIGLMGAAGAVLMIAAGASSDRSGERVLHAAGAIAVTAVGYVGAALLPTPVGRVGAFALVLIGSMCFMPPYWCLPNRLLRGTAAAAGIALVNAIASIGGFAGPYVVGRLTDATGGTQSAFLAMAGVALAGSATCLMLRRHPALTTPTAAVETPREARAAPGSR
jgi:ACS family tartrate transporter-like MFS transporter